MERKLETIKHHIKCYPVPENDQLKSWIEKAAQEYSLCWVLAHMDDGVIWGKVQQGILTLSGDVFKDVSLLLRLETLQQLRLFGNIGELFFWRTAGDTHARLLLDDGEGETITYFDESQLLWGTQVENVMDGFSLLCEGQQGLRHAIPLTLKEGKLNGRIRLCVRHYLAEDKDGQAYITISRLVQLSQPRGGKNESQTY